MNHETQFVVSVRNAREALVAAAAGADLVDVKEPLRGPLGGAEPGVIRSVLHAVENHVPVSAALGELLDWRPGIERRIPQGLAMTKFGLAGCATTKTWPDRWQQALEELEEIGTGLSRVGVVYADWATAKSPSPQCVLEQSHRIMCRAILVDTFDKSAGTLLDLWSPLELAGFVEEVHSQAMKVALAGSLSAESLNHVLPLRPDFVAVRGAVCQGGRNGALSSKRIREFASKLRSGRP